MCVSRHPSSSYKSPAYPPDLPEEQQHEDPSRQPKSVDNSEALFSMYLDKSDEDDRKATKVESRVLIFVSRLSQLSFPVLPTVTLVVTLVCRLIVSQPHLLFFPFLFRVFSWVHRTTLAFYLGNICYLLAIFTTSQPIANPSSGPSNFSPSKSAVLVNSLWFLSLLMSLTGALGHCTASSLEIGSGFRNRLISDFLCKCLELVLYGFPVPPICSRTTVHTSFITTLTSNWSMAWRYSKQLTNWFYLTNGFS